MPVKIDPSRGERQPNPKEVVRRDIEFFLHYQRALENHPPLIRWQQFANAHAAAALGGGTESFGQVNRSALGAGADEVAKVTRLHRQSISVARFDQQAGGGP